jgi:hypothetical protein
MNVIVPARLGDAGDDIDGDVKAGLRESCLHGGRRGPRVVDRRIDIAAVTDEMDAGRLRLGRRHDALADEHRNQRDDQHARDRALEAAELLSPERLGTCDDCGFSPFGDDTSTSRDTAFEKIRARVEGTRMAAEKLGL